MLQPSGMCFSESNGFSSVLPQIRLPVLGCRLQSQSGRTTALYCNPLALWIVMTVMALRLRGRLIDWAAPVSSHHLRNSGKSAILDVLKACTCSCMA